MSLDDAFARVPRPDDRAKQGKKTAYATRLAKELGIEVARALQDRGLHGVRPDPSSGSGGERRFAGGIGAKKVDVSYATEELGLALAISIKGIYFPDITRLKKDGALYFAKNLTNRKGDLLAEATTLHKRFPYAVLGGLFLFDERAASDNPHVQHTTYDRAHSLFSGFSGRISHRDAEEKFDRLAVGLCNANGVTELCWAGEQTDPITLDDYVHDLLEDLARINAGYFEYDGEEVRVR